ncbi:MAG TPA: zf-HC2 domain-containing protein [Actinoplanes sp.]|nr:zf-HC2 domain-containing protein [Actinoplanes sp.]
MRCEHEHDDGAYVLGALTPAERAAYERHLTTCSFCREAVAEVAVLPGLLGRLDAADFGKLLDTALSRPRLATRGPDPPLSPPRLATGVPDPPLSRPRLATGVPDAPISRRREHTRVRVLITALAAAVVALIAGVSAMFLTDDGRERPAQGPTVAMTPVDEAVPISAWVALAGAHGGTKIDLTCSYDGNARSKRSYTVRLMAYGPDDEFEQLGSWVAAPGKEFTMSGVTHFALGTVDRLTLVRNDGKELLTYDVR